MAVAVSACSLSSAYLCLLSFCLCFGQKRPSVRLLCSPVRVRPHTFPILQQKQTEKMSVMHKARHRHAECYTLNMYCTVHLRAAVPRNAYEQLPCISILSLLFLLFSCPSLTHSLTHTPLSFFARQDLDPPLDMTTYLRKTPSKYEKNKIERANFFKFSIPFFSPHSKQLRVLFVHT
jgi:hypothetical protein